MKSKSLSFENFKNNTISKRQLLNIFGGLGGPGGGGTGLTGGDGGTDKPGLSTSSSDGAGATKYDQNAPILGKV